MGELFGLGILLTLQDRATNGVHVATHALEDLEDQTRDVINAVSDLDRANTGLSSSNPSMTLTEMAQGMRQYTYYYDQYGRRHRYHSNQFNRELMRMTGSANDMARSLESSIRPWGQIAGMTQSGRRVASMMQGIARETRTAYRALVGFDAEGRHAISASETQSALDRYRRTVNDLQAGLHSMYQRGEIDALSYQQAVRNMAQESSRIERINQRGFRSTRQYYSMLQRAGIHTNAIENQRGIALERNRWRIEAQAEQILSMRTSASSLGLTFSRMSPILGAMTRNSFGLVDAFQRAGRAFNPLVIQARLFNEGWSGNDIQRYMTSMTAFATGFTTVFPILTLGVVAYYTALGTLAYKQIPAVQKAWERFKSSALQALQPLLEEVGKVMTKVLDLGTAFMESVQKFQKAHPIISQIATSLALILPILTLIVSGFLAVYKAGGFIWQQILANAQQAQTDLTGVGLAIGFIGSVAIYLGTTIAMFQALYKNCEGFRKAVDNTVKSVKNFIKEFKENHPTITAFFENLSFGLFTAFAGVTWLQTTFAIFAKVLRPLSPLVNRLTGAFGLLRSVGTRAINLILIPFRLFINILQHPITFLRLIGQTGSRAFRLVRMALTPLIGLIRNLPALFSTAFGVLRSLPGLIAGAFRALPGIIWGALQSVFTRALGLITRFGAWVLTYARNPLLLLRSASQLAQRAVVASFRGMGVAVRFFGTLITSPITAIRQLAGAVRGLWNTLVTRLPFSPWIIVIGILIAGIVALWKTNENFRNAVKNIWKDVCSFVTQVVNGVREAMEGKLKPVIENLKSIFSSLGTIFGTIFSAISEVLKVFFGDITGGFEKSGSAVETVTNLIVGGLTGAINILQAVLTPLAEVLKTVADYMKEHSEEIKNGMVQAYQFVASLLQAVVMPVIQAVTDFWREHGETIKQFVYNVYQGLGTVISTLVYGAFTVLQSIVQSVTAFWDEHGESIKKNVYTIYKNLVPIISGVMTAIMTIISTVGSAIVSFWEQHGESIMQSASTIWNGVCTVVAVAWAFISNVILPVVGTIVSVVIQGFANLTSFIMSHADTIKQVLTVAFQFISTAITVAVTIIGTTVQTTFTIISGIIQFVSQILTGDFAGAWNTICSTVTSVASTIWSCITTVFGGIADFITGTDWLSLGANVVQGLIDGIVGLASGAWDAICQIGQTIIDGFKSLLGIHSPSTVMAELGRYVIEGLKQGICDAGNFLLGAINQIVGYFTRMKTRIMSAISSLVSGIASKISGMVSSFTSKISSLVSSVGSKLSSMVSSAKTRISSFASSLKTGAIRAKDNVVNAVKTMISRVKGLGSQFLSIGRNMIQGLVNGVKSKASALIQSVTGAVKGAINKAKSLLGIHSPSRVFKSLGINTMEGYNIGVTQEKPKTDRAIEYALPNAQDFDMKERIGKIATPVRATTNTANTNNTNNNNRTSNDTINFNIQVQDGKSFTMEDAERIFDMLQKVKNKRDLFVY